jgi:hypothetical protein
VFLADPIRPDAKAFVGRERCGQASLDLCHADGMDVVAYYSLIYNNWAYDKHPERRMRDSTGGVA